MKHTPGPWFREGNLIYATVHAGWRQGVELFKSRFTCFIQHDQKCSVEEAEANACLIAASPDLLDALTAMVEQFGYGVVPHRTLTNDEHAAITAAMRAIKKAGGDA